MAVDDSTGRPSRVCTRCKVAFPADLEHFPPHKMGKYGLYPRCRPCKKQEDAERRARPDQKVRQQKWRDENKAYVKAYNEGYREAGYKSTEHARRWREQNLEKSRVRERLNSRAYRERYPEKHRAAVRTYYREHREQVIAKTVKAYREKPWVNLKHKIAGRLRLMLNGKAGRRTVDLLGYGRAELLAHIERQFTKGMTWEKVLSGEIEIEIDHIVPVRAFRIQHVGDAEFRACWALSNLRPLWARDNRIKGGKVLTLL